MFKKPAKIAAQMIVFNAESTLPKGMLQAQLNQLYSLADRIVIVEGASFGKGPRYDGNSRFATKDGRSTDGTVAAIKCFPDPQKKIVLVEARGFWDGKVEMCNEALKHMGGMDYVWQVDSDEFYHDRDILRVKEILASQRPAAIHFRAFHFWGGFTDCITPQTGKAWGNDQPWRRVFRLSPGCQWKTHEPPDLVDEKGKSMNDNAINADAMMNAGVMMYHYGYAVETQMRFKLQYYARPEYFQMWMAWKKDKVTKLFGSTTVPFSGQHPEILRDVISLNRP